MPQMPLTQVQLSLREASAHRVGEAVIVVTHDPGRGAIEGGEETPEVFAAKGHIQFELEQFDDAIKTYERLLTLAPRHQTANFNARASTKK